MDLETFIHKLKNISVSNYRKRPWNIIKRQGENKNVRKF